MSKMKKNVKEESKEVSVNQLNMRVAIPGKGITTIGEVLTQIEAEEPNENEYTKNVLKGIWELGKKGLRRGEIRKDIINKIKEEKNLSRIPISINHLLKNNYLLEYKREGKKALYFITEQGAKFAGLE